MRTTILPPEWAPQSAVMLTWPHDQSDWQPWLNQVEPVFVRIAYEVCRREHLLVVCHDEPHKHHVAALLKQAEVPADRCRLYCAPSNDTWARDHGPLTVISNGKPLLLDFIFNGWGGKFDAALDNLINQRLHKLKAFGEHKIASLDLVLEGGSIEVDGYGTLLTTSRCLLAPTRNPDLSKSELEMRLSTLLGIKRCLWLNHGYLAGDDTDSHIDTLARFCDAHTIAYVACDDSGDEHYRELQAMEAELHQFQAWDGRPYRLVPLPWPQPKYNQAGRRLPATYANFLIINGAVLAPTYNDPADGKALEVLQSCFPDREIVAIPCSPLIMQYGSLHCVTMQLPADVLA